jgi:hypothetical protein
MSESDLGPRLWVAFAAYLDGIDIVSVGWRD